jgi:hypothetical protein
MRKHDPLRHRLRELISSPCTVKCLKDYEKEKAIKELGIERLVEPLSPKGKLSGG